MDKTKEQIQEYFNVLDKDGSGTIEKEEIKQLAENLGLNWDDQKFDNIIQALDTNGDGKISFDEFYVYFLYGEQKQMDKLIQMKFQHIKNVKNLHKKLSQEYAHIFNKNHQEGKSQYSVSFNVGGKSHYKQEAEFTLRVGEENKNFSESLLKNFPFAGNHIVSFIFGFKCQNSDVVQEKFQAFFESTIDLAISMLPPGISQQVEMFKQDLTIEYKALPDELLIRFYIHNELTENALMKYRMISGMFIQENSSLYSKMKIQFDQSFQSSRSSSKQDLIDLLNWISNGFAITFDTIVTNDFIEYGRQIYYAIIDKYLESYKIKKFEHLTPLTLIENARLKFNFQSYEQFAKEMGLPELNEANLQVAQDNTKLNDLINTIPNLGELFEILQQEGVGILSFTLISQEASISIELKGEKHAAMFLGKFV